MSRQDDTSTAAKHQQEKSFRLLLSIGSYDPKFPPSPVSCGATILVFILTLVSLERGLRFLLSSFPTAIHESLFLNADNRAILARYAGVDFVGCLFCAYTGLQTIQRGVGTTPIMQAFWKGKMANLPEAAYAERMFHHHPAAFHIAIFFLSYQIKDLMDTLAWGDGPEFIVHHAFSILTAYGSLSQGVGLAYGVFFFGISEVSTAVLCVLANFDDDHGIVGLGDAFPLIKASVGGIFAILFIVCRCILWPLFAYHFARDVLSALKANDRYTQSRRGWLKFFLVSLTSLSVLQIGWLGQIFYIGHQEMKKMGFI